MIVSTTTDYSSNVITGIAGKKGLSVIHIEKDMMNAEVGFGRKVLSVLEDCNIPFEHLPSGIDTVSVVMSNKQINGRLEDASRLLMAMEGALTTLTSRLDALESERDGRKKLCAVLSAEVDMLYEIFNSAALPQYLKDRVGERIAYMKAEISEMAQDEEV
jgi:hypothetical protein